jgi:hypothetical protein
MRKLATLLLLSLLVFGILASFPILTAQYNSGSGSSDSDDSTDDNSGSDDQNDDDSSDDDSEDDDSSLEVEIEIESEDDDEDETDNEFRIRERTREMMTEGGCTIRVETEIKIENGKRVEVVKRKIVCEDGSKVEIQVRIENRTVNGKFRERIRYEAHGEHLDVEAEEGIELEEETNATHYKLRARLRNGNATDIKIMPDTASEIALERLRALNFTIELREVRHRNIPRVVYNIETNKSGKFLGVFKLALKVEGQVDPETGEFIGISKPWWAFLVSGEDSDQTDDEESNQITINLAEQNDSGESGTAILKEEDGQVIVTIDMTGFTEDVSQPAHIHVGVCPDVGAVVYPLTNVLNGESETTLDVTFAQLESELPLGINVHKSVDEASIYTACGDIEF